MRGVLHAEVFGFNFSADINPCQRSDDCVIAAGQITERPRRLSKTSADAPETERGTQVGGYPRAHLHVLELERNVADAVHSPQPRSVSCLLS